MQLDINRLQELRKTRLKSTAWQDRSEVIAQKQRDNWADEEFYNRRKAQLAIEHAAGKPKGRPTTVDGVTYVSVKEARAATQAAGRIFFVNKDGTAYSKAYHESRHVIVMGKEYNSILHATIVLDVSAFAIKLHLAGIVADPREHKARPYSSRRRVTTVLGVTYPSLKHAARAHNVGRGTLLAYLQGKASQYWTNEIEKKHRN